MRGKTLFAWPLLLSVLLLGACAGQGEDEQVDPSAQVWAEVLQLETELESQRAELAEWVARLEAPAEEEGEASSDDAADGAEEEAEGEEGETLSPEELEAKVDEMRATVKSKTDEVYGKIVEYLNSSEMYEGEELTAEQKAAFEKKAGIDILYAQEYIDKGGDYKRAIDIFNQALHVDPDNEALLAAKEEAERLRYMDSERFEQVKKGMNQEEVRALLGTVKATNQRDFPDKNLVGWFYPKDGGGAAGVYFKEKKKDEGEWIVYAMDYEAVKSPAEGGGEGEG